jgi:hypothetical protein
VNNTISDDIGEVRDDLVTEGYSVKGEGWEKGPYRTFSVGCANGVTMALIQISDRLAKVARIVQFQYWYALRY